MHGYVALAGFGITRIRNQAVARREIIMKVILAGTFVFFRKSEILFTHAGSVWSLSSEIILNYGV